MAEFQWEGLEFFVFAVAGGRGYSGGGYLFLECIFQLFAGGEG